MALVVNLVGIGHADGHDAVLDPSPCLAGARCWSACTWPIGLSPVARRRVLDGGRFGSLAGDRRWALGRRVCFRRRRGHRAGRCDGFGDGGHGPRHWRGRAHRGRGGYRWSSGHRWCLAHWRRTAREWRDGSRWGRANQRRPSSGRNELHRRSRDYGGNGWVGGDRSYGNGGRLRQRRLYRHGGGDL